MQVKPDGSQHRAWAVIDAEGHIKLAEVCDSADAARMLLKAMRIRQPHRRDTRMAEITISIRSATQQ